MSAGTQLLLSTLLPEHFNPVKRPLGEINDGEPLEALLPRATKTEGDPIFSFKEGKSDP